DPRSPAPERRDHFHGLPAGVPGHGHRHGQGHTGAAPGGAAPRPRPGGSGRTLQRRPFRPGRAHLDRGDPVPRPDPDPRRGDRLLPSGPHAPHVPRARSGAPPPRTPGQVHEDPDEGGPAALAPGARPGIRGNAFEARRAPAHGARPGDRAPDRPADRLVARERAAFRGPGPAHRVRAPAPAGGALPAHRPARPGHDRHGSGPGGRAAPRRRLRRRRSGNVRHGVHRTDPVPPGPALAGGRDPGHPAQHPAVRAPPVDLAPAPAPRGRHLAGRHPAPGGAGRGDRSTRAQGDGAVKIGITCYPVYGGSGVVATELGLELARRGHEVHFITYAQPFRLPYFVESVFYHHVEVPSYPLFDYPPYGVALAAAMHSVAERQHLDLLHVHYAVPHATSAWLAREMLGRDRIKVVTTLHGTDITLVGQDPSFRSITRFSIRESDGLTAVSEYLRRETNLHFDIPAEDIEVIPNFVDLEKYRRDSYPCHRSMLAPAGEKIVMHISNFRPVKRVADVLRIFARIDRDI